MPFINNPDFSSALTIFIISFISSLEIINIVLCKVNPQGRPQNASDCSILCH